MVIAEAMALGKPVIATNVGGIRHMLIDNVTGYIVKPDDISSLVEKIDMLLSDGSLRHKMGINARKIAELTYHPEIIAKQTLESYYNVLGSKE